MLLPALPWRTKAAPPPGNSWAGGEVAAAEEGATERQRQPLPSIFRDRPVLRKRVWARSTLDGFPEEGPFGLDLEDREMRGGRGEIPGKDNSLYEAQRPVREGLRGFLESWSTPSSLCTSPHALLRRLE